MRTFIACVLSFALIGSALSAANVPASSTASTNSQTAGSFNSTPTKVLDVTNASVLTTVYDGSWYNALYTNAVFGPGTTNSTVYLWGLGFTGSASPYSLNLIVRTISATIVAYGNDTVEAAVPSGTADNTATVTTTNTPRNQVPVYAVGPAQLGVAVVLQTGTGTAAADVLVFYPATTSAWGTPKTVATASTPTTANSATTTYSYAVNQLWYEDGCFYMLYEAQSTTATAPTVTGLYVQGYFTANSSLLYTAGMAVSTTFTNTGSTLGTAVTGARAQNSNYTGSTSIYVIWNDLTVASTGYTVVKGAIVTRYTGSAGSATTLVTGTATTTTYTASGVVAGLNASTAVYGWIVTTYASSAATVNVYYNTNTTATSASITESSPSSGATMATGFNYGTGFAIVGYYPTASGKTYFAQTYLNTYAVNTTQVTLGTFATTTQANTFADANGALWFGYVEFATETATRINSAYLGKLFGQINSTTTTTFGNVLATFAALLSFVIMSLFMF